jgi:hypothetical protein
MNRIALLLVIGGVFAAGPAVAQFGDLFGNSPPRPPANIPNGPFPSQPPPVQYPGQSAPNGTAASPYPAAPAPSSVEAQPLPPPPGTEAAPGATPARRTYPQQPLPPPQPPQRSVPAPAAANRSPGKSGPAGPPGAAGPAAAVTEPPIETIVEAPTPHIENRRAIFAGLNKISGRTISFDVDIGKTVQFGALQVTPRACYTRPPTEATNTDAFVEVDELTLQGELKRIFTGWMFTSSPGLNAVEHPIYDVWLTGCEDPVEARAEEPAPRPTPTGSRTRRPPRSR